MEIPAQINLKAGEQYALRLPGLGAAGYVWEHSVVGDDQVVRVSEAVSGQPAPPGGSPPAAQSTDTVFTIAALKPGRVTVRFTQRRPWERDQPPLKEVVIEVSVTM